MKAAFVTGGSRGIGRAICLRLAREGYAVAVGYSTGKVSAEDVCEDIRASGGTAFAVGLDLADDASVNTAYEQVKCELGIPEVLVNNGGIAHIGLYTDMTDSDVIRLINTDLVGTMLLSRRAAKDMLTRHCGRIVNIASVWGEAGASCEVAYSAAKAGIIGFTKALGKELAPSGITVNCISPGVIDTDMNACLNSDDKAALIAEIPAGRMGTPDEVASLAAYLCSAEAQYITAQVIRIDGAWI